MRHCLRHCKMNRVPCMLTQSVCTKAGQLTLGDMNVAQWLLDAVGGKSLLVPAVGVLNAVLACTLQHHESLVAARTMMPTVVASVTMSRVMRHWNA